MATDYFNRISLQMQSTANTLYTQPLYTHEMVCWANSAGNYRVNIEICQNNNPANLQEGECWLEATFISNSVNILGSTITTANSTILNISTANIPLSTASWSNFTTPIKQKLSTNVYPNTQSAILCRVALAKPSVNVWVDPYPNIIKIS